MDGSQEDRGSKASIWGGDREVRLEPVPGPQRRQPPWTPGQEERSCLHIKTRARLRKAMWPRVTLHWASVLALVTG